MMRGGGVTRRLAIIVTCAILTVPMMAGPAHALGRPQDRWARPDARKAPVEPRENSLTGVLRQIWRGQQAEAAAKLGQKASAHNTSADEAPPAATGTAVQDARPAVRTASSSSEGGAPADRPVRAAGGGLEPHGTKAAPVARRRGAVRVAAAGPAAASKKELVEENSKPSKAVVAKATGGAVPVDSSSRPTTPPVQVAANAGATSTQGTVSVRGRTDNPAMPRRRSPGKVKNTLRVLTGKSLIIDLAKDAKRVSVANPEVAEVMIISARQVMVNGLEDGETSIIIWDNAGHYAMYNLVVGDALDDQVMLEVTVAEINRTELERHGVDIRAFGGQFRGITQYGNVAPVSGTHPPTAGNPPFPIGLGSGLSWGIVDAKNDIAALFKQLQDKDMAKILAEPKLLARSGETANFLSGGEIPIVITQQQNTTIEFKEFGTKIEFIPTVREDGSIDLKVKSEVSEPDFSQGLQLFGFTVPAFVTRRVDTNVTLGDSESLIVAGLMKEKKRDFKSKMPVVGDIPVLGYFFRRTEHSTDVLELVIVVKPHLVAPIGENENVALPTD